MKKLILLILLTCSFAMAGERKLSTSGEPSVSDTLFYSSGKVDTIKVRREKGVEAMSFYIYTPDSSNIKDLILFRVANNTRMSVQAGDTLIVSDSSGSVKLRIETVPMEPLAEQYDFVVTYNSTIIDSVHLESIPVDSIDFTRGDTILIHSPLAYNVDTLNGRYAGFGFQRFDTTSTPYSIVTSKTISGDGNGEDSLYVIITGDASGIIWNQSATSMNWMFYKQLGIYQGQSNHARYGIIRRYNWQ